MNTTIDHNQLHDNNLGHNFNSKSEVMPRLKNRFKFEPLNIEH